MKSNIKGSIEAEFLWTFDNRKMAQSHRAYVMDPSG
jgi:hypothetical protein